MDKLFAAKIVSLLLVGIFVAQLADGSPDPTPEEAYAKLFEKGVRVKSREKVVGLLRLIASDPQQVEKVRAYRYDIGQLISYNDISGSKCTRDVMTQFRAMAIQAQSRGQAVDQYVVATYQEQLQECLRTAKAAVQNFIRANSAAWPHFMEFYFNMSKKNQVFSKPHPLFGHREWQMKDTMRENLKAIVEKQHTGKLQKKAMGSHVYDSMTGVINTCRNYNRDGLIQLLQIQVELNSAIVSKDRELLEYLRYLDLCKELVNINQWGQGVQDQLVEEVAPGWTEGTTKLTSWLDANNDAAVYDHSGSSYNYADQDNEYHHYYDSYPKY